MSESAKSNKVTLVHSGEKGGYVHFPLSILYLAASLQKNGFEPRLVDLRVQDFTPDDIDGSLYLGVSTMTGSMQIPPALACAAIAESRSVPVVFGGAHPSMLLEQTCAHPLVDIAVKGEGEEVAVEIAEHFQGKRDLSSIKGIAYKDESGKVLLTADRKPPPFDEVTHLPYHLLPMEEYLASKSDFGFQSSRGCPHRCAFCAEVALYARTWRPKPARIVVEEIEEIIRQFNPERIFFYDSNFFCSKKRVEEFCSLIIERGIKTKFYGECRFDYFSKYHPEFLDLIKRAGFNENLFGGESGSDATLAFIKKDINTEQIIKSIEMCKEAGLKSFTSFMIGFPGESDREMRKTLEMYDRILTIDPEGAKINGMFVYSPFPGTELFNTAVEKYEYVPPQSLDGWAKFELYDSSNITWLDEKKKRKVQTISTLVRYFFVHKTLKDWAFSEKVKRHGGFLKAILSTLFDSVLYPIARLRWRMRFFDLGYEFKFWQKVFHAYMGRK
jgi:anaerobic magnesium-protoporphyrin IX monomethyl ester cyclase